MEEINALYRELHKEAQIHADNRIQDLTRKGTYDSEGNLIAKEVVNKRSDGTLLITSVAESSDRNDTYMRIFNVKLLHLICERIEKLEAAFKKSEEMK